MEQQESQTEGVSAMMGEVRRVSENAATRASGGKVEETKEEALPMGTSSVETEVVAESSESAPAAESAPEPVEEPIRIAGREFRTQDEAFRWAEEQERERLLAEAHSAGIREALAAQQAAIVTPPVPEEDFETKFYSNPKETLREIQTRARDEAVNIMRAETAKERAWIEFSNLYPDIRRQDAEGVLAQHADTIGKLPKDKGFQALANAVYKEYDEIANMRKPKQVLSDRKPAVSPSGSAPRGVTPQKKEEKPLSFADQLKRLNKK
jgi:hypothetical protein